MIRLYDQHVHSKRSIDSEAEPDEVCRRAVQAGLAGITFTEHFDTHPGEFDRCRFDYEVLRADIDRLRDSYAERLRIGMGIEVCYQPEQMGFVLDFLEKHSFDLVMLSVHWFGGRALHIREHWSGLDARRGTRLYLRAVLDAVRFCLQRGRRGERPFDVLGHLDLVKRYTMRYFSTFEIHAHADLIDEILAACVEADLLVEINTSTARSDVGETCPAGWVIRRYAELGGRAACLGSDAHQTEHVGAGLPEAAQMMRDAPLPHLAVFSGRIESLKAV